MVIEIKFRFIFKVKDVIYNFWNLCYIEKCVLDGSLSIFFIYVLVRCLVFILRVWEEKYYLVFC